MWQIRILSKIFSRYVVVTDIYSKAITQKATLIYMRCPGIKNNPKFINGKIFFSS
jgi:hypothetical protein